MIFLLAVIATASMVIAIAALRYTAPLPKLPIQENTLCSKWESL